MVVRLSNQGKIAMSLMIRTYKKSNKSLTIIAEQIAILLIFNKLKLNFVLRIMRYKSKISLKTIILIVSTDL